MLRTFLAATCGLVLFAGAAVAEEKSPIELKIVLKKESIAWPYDFGPKEFEAKLKEEHQEQGRQLSEAASSRPGAAIHQHRQRGSDPASRRGRESADADAQRPRRDQRRGPKSVHTRVPRP